MTKIVFGRAPDGQLTFVDLLGHAGYADEGEDIVCAAVTSAIQFVHVLLDDVKGLVFDTEVEPVGTHIRLSFPPAVRGSVQDTLEALRIHYHEMQENYAEFIQVTEVYSHAEN